MDNSKNRENQRKEKMKKYKEGDLRVWHIPQVPMQAFYVPVKNIEEAKKILIVLADYDIFQFENKVKPDYSNAAGLQEFQGGDWTEYCNQDGDDIYQIMRNEDQ